MPHGGQRVDAPRAPRRAAARVRHAAQPRVRVLVPARHRRAEVLGELGYDKPVMVSVADIGWPKRAFSSRIVCFNWPYL